jgi:hypothetical protein
MEWRINFFELPPERFNGKIPFVVSDLIDQLTIRHADDLEGVFRLNGPNTEIVQLSARLSRGRITTWPEDVNPHTLTGTLKRYLAKMAEREALIPAHQSNDFLASMLVKSTPERSRVLRQSVNLLDPVRRKTLAFLCRYWHSLTLKADKNQMGPQNLSVCVSQVVMTPASGNDAADTCRQVAASNHLVTVLIESYLDIFADVQIMDSDFCTEDDVITIQAPKFRMDNIDQLILRDTLRRQSLIPWVPLCRIELCQIDLRPTQKPVRGASAAPNTARKPQ